MDRIFGKPMLSTDALTQEDEHWISMSDLMAGLMMVFLFISVAFMRYVQVEKDKIKEVAVAYQNSQVALYEELNKEFESDLVKWDAEVDQATLEFRFNSPEVLFGTGKISLKPQFKVILNSFFPRYLAVIDNFKKDINEIRIEGHTSSVWSSSASEDIAYFNNMELSQGRTRSVLQYVYSMSEVADEREWIKSKFAAVGFSSSQLILQENGQEDFERSRRVSFKIITNAETQIRKIITN